MAGYIATTVVGNLGNDAELKYLPSGVPVLNFNVAANIVTGSGENRQETTTWVRCAIWRERAEKLAQFLVKGKQVMVVGRPTVRAYTNNAGEAQASFDLNVDEIVLLGSANGSNQAAAQENVTDIPF